jgi:iron complex outermembrane recepter protein
MRHIRRTGLSLSARVLILTSVLVGGTTLDRTASADPPSVSTLPATTVPDSEAGLQEIVVTANRREQNLQSVPIAVTAITAQTAGEMGITDTQSLAAAIPGLNFNRQANSSIPFLRGIGSPVGETGDEPSVAFYVDDVYIPAGNASVLNFSSIESMEVEKGPQGTLFGRNATGGVIQVYTRNPSSTPSIEVTGGYANYNTTSSSLYVTGPLAPTLAANVSLYQSNQQDGWGTDFTTGSPTYRGWDNGGRAKLLWTPTDRFSALLTYDLDRTSTGEGIAYTPAAGTVAVPGIPGPSGYYNTLGNINSQSTNEQQGVSLKLTSDFDWSKLVSISAWRQTKGVEAFAYDPVPPPIANVLITNPERTLTQELRLLSPEGQKWSWIVGAYYYHDTAGFDPLQFTGAAFAPFPQINGYGLEYTKSWAGFADTTYPILPDTNITAGVRYTQDKRQLDAGAVFGDGPAFGLPAGYVPAANSPQSATWSKPTYRLILDHNFTPDVMAYVAYNRGFKSGLFNPVVNPGSPIGPPVQPETLDAYTAGAKTEFFDHKLRVNTEFFYYKDKNIQVDEVSGAATYITNAATATIKGVDLDITAQPIERVTITASIEALDGHYGSFPNGQFFVYQPNGSGNCAFTVTPAPGPVPCGGLALPPGYNSKTGTWNLSGDQTMQSPPFSSYLSAAYRIPTAIGKFDLSASWTHTGNYYADADNGRGQVAPSSPNNDRQGILNLINSSLAWTSMDEHWSARFWGKNLTGKEYWSFALEDAFNTQYSPAPPRTYGVTVSTRW